MKTLSCRPFYTLFLLCILALCWGTPALAKKQCKALQEKLHKIQSMQRSGYSLKRGQSLRAREDKAREKWWQCEHPSYRKQRTTKTKKKSAKKKKYGNKSKQLVKNSYKANRKSNKVKLVDAPFSSIGTIVIKSSFQGHKKLAWQRFYQQPTKCNRPKSLTMFAFCSEDKQEQKAEFEQHYTTQ